MLKNKFKIVVAALLCTGSLFAGTVGGGSDGRLMSTAYFDVHTQSQAPMLDYIKYSKRASFDTKQYISTLEVISKAAGAVTIYIQGRVIVPDSIKTKLVYIDAGKTYNSYKKIYYNGSKIPQDAEYFLVATKTDAFGNRYVDYKIVQSGHYGITYARNKEYYPNTIVFSMAPKKRGFKNKFQKCDIYVLDE